MAEAIRREILQVDPAAARHERPADEAVRIRRARPRLSAVLLGAGSWLTQ